MLMNEPKLWNKLLSEAPKGSVLMGGAIIDYMFGVSVNDFDIFYTYKPGPPLLLPQNWKQTDVDFNDAEWIKEHEEAYLQGIDENGNHPISSVLEYMVDGEHKVQLIGVNYADPADHIKNFDHSLTLGKYTKHGMSIHRKVFESYDEKVITYVSKNFDPEAVAKSLKRAHKKALKISHDFWDYEGFNPVPKIVPAKKVWFA